MFKIHLSPVSYSWVWELELNKENQIQTKRIQINESWRKDVAWMWQGISTRDTGIPIGSEIILRLLNGIKWKHDLRRMQGWAVRKPINSNPELTVNRNIHFSCAKISFSALVLCSLRFFKLKPEGKQYKQKTAPKSYKTQIKILANPALVQPGFERSGPRKHV